MPVYNWNNTGSGISNLQTNQEFNLGGMTTPLAPAKRKKPTMGKEDVAGGTGGAPTMPQQPTMPPIVGGATTPAPPPPVEGQGPGMPNPYNLPPAGPLDSVSQQSVDSGVGGAGNVAANAVMGGMPPAVSMGGGGTTNIGASENMGETDIMAGINEGWDEDKAYGRFDEQYQNQMKGIAETSRQNLARARYMSALKNQNTGFGGALVGGQVQAGLSTGRQRMQAEMAARDEQFNKQNRWQADKLKGQLEYLRALWGRASDTERQQIQREMNRMQADLAEIQIEMGSGDDTGYEYLDQRRAW